RCLTRSCGRPNSVPPQDIADGLVTNHVAQVLEGAINPIIWQWTAVKRPVLETMLTNRFILYGEWLYARHSVHYRKLPHYFFEFDIYDKDAEQFLDLEKRLAML